MVEIRLTATRLVADGDQLYSIASALRTGIASADGTLSGFSGMAGNDNLGEVLAEGYDGRAEIYLRNAHAIMANVGALDGILCATGAAYDDVQSFGSGGSGSTIVVPSFSEGPQPSLPSALGGSWEGNFGPIDLGVAQEAIEDALTALGLAYPNANVDQLTAAASAFSLLESDLRRASSSLSSALTAASSMDLPQWPTIDGTRNDLVRLLDERVDECVDMQNFINGALGEIDKAKQDFALNLGQLVLEIALDVGITAALTLVTGPLGAALGSVKILATIAKWVNRIRESILAARIAIIALREALKGAAVSAASAAGASVVFDGMVRGQWDRVGVAALSSAAGGFVGGPISHALSGGSRGIIRNALAGGGSGAVDGAASELVASSMENRDFNLLAGAGMGILTGTAGGGATQAVTNALPNRANVGGNVATPQVQAGTNNGRPQPVSAGGGRPGADAPANAPQPGPAAAPAAAAATGGAAPRTDANAPQPGAGTGGGGSQPAGGGAPPIDSSAPQPGAGGDGGSQPAPSNAPEVPSGDLPTADLPAGDTPTAPPADAPGVEAPGVDAPAPADAGTSDGPSVQDILADAPSVDAILADAPSVDAILADVPSADAIVDGAPTVDDIVAGADAGTEPASDGPSQETPSPASSSTDAPPVGGPDRDASGIPLVGLPNLPGALPVDTPTTMVDGDGGTVAPRGGLPATPTQVPDLDAPTQGTSNGDSTVPVDPDASETASDGAEQGLDDLGALDGQENAPNAADGAADASQQPDSNRLDDSASEQFQFVLPDLPHRELPQHYQDVLEAHGRTAEEAHDLRRVPVELLDDKDVSLLRDLRDSVPPIDRDTLLSKVIPDHDIAKYLDGSYAQVGGFIGRVGDVEFGDLPVVVDDLRLDYTPKDGEVNPYLQPRADRYGVIEFTSDDVDLLEVPYSERFGGASEHPRPFTGNGMTGANRDIFVPEWEASGDRLTPRRDSNLYVVENGVRTLAGVFRNGRFWPVDGA